MKQTFWASVWRSLRLLRDYLPLITVLGSAMVVVIFVTLRGLWAIYGSSASEWLRNEIGVTANTEAIAEMNEAWREAAGLNRVIRQPHGQTFVEEPVRIGETLVLSLAIARTERGADCVYNRAIPLFTDAYNVTTPGSFAGSGRQYGTEIVVTRMRITPPPALHPGRTTIQLQIQYECDGEPVLELTDPVAFYLLPEEG